MLLDLGCAALAKRLTDLPPARRNNQDPIPRSLNALALLASGKPEYLPLVKQEAEWASGYTADGMQTWRYGYCMLLVSEYILATEDKSMLPGLRRLALETAKGQSAVGSWGHGFALSSGRLGGYGMMNSPGIPLTASLVLARKAGVNDPEVANAIELSARLLRFYIGKGSIPYGDHDPWIQGHEDNGKCGMAAVLFNLLNEPRGADFFSRMSIAAHGGERDCGHTGNYFNILWAMPGIAISNKHATGAWMNEYGGWYFDLARRWDYSYAHQGPPEKDNDTYRGWDNTGAILLAYAIPRRKLYLLGKGNGLVPPMHAPTAAALIEDGRGWDNKDRNSFYDKLSEAQLIERLGSWSPIVRERAALALGRRKETTAAPLLPLLEAPRLETRYGACQALCALRGRAAPAVDALQKCLAHEDLWLRIKAAEALAKIGKPATPAVPQLLTLLTKSDPVHDPRNMQQRYMTMALFDNGGLLSRSLDGVDRGQLYQAVRAGLQNQDGRARGSLGSVYRHLTAEELQPLLPAIYQAVVEPAPSGEMFADEIRVEGLRLLAKHQIEEGIQACVTYAREQNPWASQKRTPELMKILLSYGTHAQRVVPELTKLEDYFANKEPNFPKNLMRVKAESVRETIQAIQAASETPELRRLPK